MEILTGKQMRDVDRHAIETLGIPGLQLMEAAGSGVAEALLRDYPDSATRPVLILCGKGNNGGDGFVVARHLRNTRMSSSVILFADPAMVQRDAAASYEAACKAGIEVNSITEPDGLDRLDRQLESSPLVLDCLLGTGIQGGVRGLLAEVVKKINDSGCEIVSVDLPSGLDADSLELAGEPVRATRTYTLCRPKLPLASGPTDAFAGRWSVLDIGIPDESVSVVNPDMEWLDEKVATRLMPDRPAESHKGTYGHLLAVTGSRGKGGAAVLLGRAALRSGVGLCTLAVPGSMRVEVASEQAELMTEPLAETERGTVSSDSVETVLGLSAGKDAVALGPGMGRPDEIRDTVAAVVERCEIPMVIDADGLNALAAGKNGLKILKKRTAVTVLTPHPKEAARLLGRTVAEIQADRLAAARSLAGGSGTTVVLKGHRTVVAQPDGQVSFNSTGNPGMATAGTGDVLTGIIGAYLAGGCDPFDAARLGTHIHGLAGDLAVCETGPDSLIASDLLEHLPGAVRRLRTLAEKG